MHVYIYDSFLNHSKYNSLLAKIETRITDLGLNGKICRLGAIKNFNNTIQGEIARGAKTIIAVGNDATVSQVVNALAGSEVPLGIIPIGKENNLIASALGIDIDLTACDVLSARRVEQLDLGEVNGLYFLTEASITTDQTMVEINQDYTIEILEPGEVKIVNLPLNRLDLPEAAKFNPQDKHLELYIKTSAPKKLLKKGAAGQSVFSFKRLSIQNNQHSLLLDNLTELQLPATVSISNFTINVIVGKNRNF